MHSNPFSIHKLSGISVQTAVHIDTADNDLTSCYWFIHNIKTTAECKHSFHWSVQWFLVASIEEESIISR